MSNEIIKRHIENHEEEKEERKRFHVHPLFFAASDFTIDIRVDPGTIHLSKDDYEIIPVKETEAISMKEYDSGMILETREEQIARQVRREDEVRYARSYTPPEVPKMKYPKVKMTRTSLAAFFRQFLP